MSTVIKPHGVLIDRDALIAEVIQPMVESRDPYIRGTGETFKQLLLERPEVVPYEDHFDLRNLHLE